MQIVIVVMGLAMFVVTGFALQSGEIYCKGCTFKKAENPIGFWSTVACFIAFGSMFFYFGLTATSATH